VPLVRPDTVVDKVPPPTPTGVHAGVQATVYPEIGIPPALTGAVQLTEADEFPAVAVTLAGALGTVGGW